jgi:tetratricopeptide (TPR) repeat protein
MTPFLHRLGLLSTLMLVLCATPSIGLAKVRDAQNCTANPALKPDIRISACTRLLNQTGALEDFADAAILSNRASAYLQKGNYNYALRDLTEAVRLLQKPSNNIDDHPLGRMIAAGIYGNRGIVYLALNRKSEAAADFINALLNEPSIQKYKDVLAHIDESE